MTARPCLTVLLVALLVAGCGTESTEQVADTTPSSQAQASSAAPGQDPLPLKDYLETIDVYGTPTPFAQVPALTVTVPVPQGWKRETDPVFASGIDYISRVGNETLYPSAQLMLIQLDGDFDPHSVIQHGNVDALPPNSTERVESFDDYQGFPSAMAQGLSDGRQNYSRIIIATSPSGAHYLVQLTAATDVGQTIASSPDLQSVIDGFTVTVR